MVELEVAVAAADQIVKINGKWEWGKRGKYRIIAMNVMGPRTGNGGRNGEYELELSWHELEQPKLI